MTQSNTNFEPLLQDAILELMVSEKLPDAELVEGVVKRYPEIAEEITEFAVELAVDMLVNRDNDIEVLTDIEEISPAVGRAISNFENELFERRKQHSDGDKLPVSAPDAKLVDPFLAMDRSAFRAFAGAIHASTLFAVKIRDRQITLSTIPLSYLKMIADTLRFSIDQLRDYLNHRNGRLAPGTQFFKADDKPDHNIQQSFEEAVTDSGLTEEQQQFLLSLK